MSYKRTQAEVGLKTIRVPEAQRRYGLGREGVKKIAKECGAVVRVGRSFLVNVERMDKFMEDHTVEPTEEEMAEARALYGDD